MPSCPTRSRGARKADDGSGHRRFPRDRARRRRGPDRRRDPGCRLCFPRGARGSWGRVRQALRRVGRDRGERALHRGRPLRLRRAERRRARAGARRGFHRRAVGSGPRRQPPRRVPLRAGSIPHWRDAHRRDRIHQRYAGNGARGGLQCQQVGPDRPRQVAGGRRARTGHFLRRGLAGRGGHRDAQADAVSAPPPPPRSCAGGEVPLHRRALRDDGERRRGVRVSALAQELAALGLQTAAIDPYSRDESGCGEYPPQAAVQARDATDVQKLLAFSRARKIPVVPRGAGSGKSGGALAERGGIVLSLEKLDRIVEVSRADMVCVVQPGVVLETLQKAVEEQGLFYPPDPNSQAMCSIGGNLAHNAGGPRAVKYGVTSNYVLGLQAVLADGTVVRTGHRSWKGVAGYDLTHLLVGSGGTLAVITEATLKLIPLPRRVETLLALFPDEDAAASAVQAIFDAGLLPRACELFDGPTMRAVSPRAPFKFPDGVGGGLLVEHDGHGDGVAEELARSGELCTEQGAIEVLAAQDEAQRRKLWGTRRLVSIALGEWKPHKISEDVAVPRGKLVEMIRAVRRIGQKHGFPTASYGHAGDGNLHVNLLFASADERIRGYG